MAKTILVDSPSFALFNPRLHVTLGLLYLAGSLREARHDVSIADCYGLTSWDVENKRLVVHRELLPECDVLGVYCVTPNSVFGSQLAEAWPATYKVAGGPHITHILEGPHERFKKQEYFEGFDYLFSGEAEKSFIDFCNAIHSDCSSVAGISWFDKSGALHKNPSVVPPDVLRLAPPAFDLIAGRFRKGGLTVKSIAGRSLDDDALFAGLCTERGCPYNCNFCGNVRTRLRAEALVQVEAEVKQLVALGVQSIKVWDDCFTLHRDRCMRIADILNAYGIKWRACTRVNLTDAELFHYLGTHGCTEMAFGIEHGSAKMLDLMGKGTTPEINRRSVKMCQDAGIVARAFLIIGFPGETWETLDEMKVWLLKAKPDAARLHLFQPYPGCDVWNRPEVYGVTIPDSAFSRMWQLGNDDDIESLVLDLPTMSKEELFRARLELTAWIQANISEPR